MLHKAAMTFTIVSLVFIGWRFLSLGWVLGLLDGQTGIVKDGWLWLSIHGRGKGVMRSRLHETSVEFRNGFVDLI
jgi:hypothetical protein